MTDHQQDAEEPQVFYNGPVTTGPIQLLYTVPEGYTAEVLTAEVTNSLEPDAPAEGRVGVAPTGPVVVTLARMPANSTAPRPLASKSCDASTTTDLNDNPWALEGGDKVYGSADVADAATLFLSGRLVR
jgi:hypothetical protein